MTTNPFGVERADADDAVPLFEFLMPIYGENSLQPVSATKVGALVHRCVERDQAIAGVVRGTGDTPIVASIGLVVDEADYTDDKQLRAVWAFTHPAHRKENHLKKMVEFAKWCQEGLQKSSDTPIPLLLQILTTEALEGQMRCYQRSIPQFGALFSWGAAIQGQYDQVQIGTGRGHMGRNQGQQSRVGLHRTSPLINKWNRPGRAA